MGKISTFSSFEEGARAGDKLVALVNEISPGTVSATPASERDVKPVLEEIWKHAPGGSEMPSVAGFFSRVLRRKDWQGAIIEMWGTENFLENQQQVAPICNVSPEEKMIQFASWTGEGDGDAWVLDLGQTGCVRCLPVSMGGEDPMTLRAYSYGVFDDWHYLVAFLRCAAELRRWI
jgi:hypothetical protein